MTAEELLAALEHAGLALWAEDDQIRYRGPRGALTEAHRSALGTVRSELLGLLQNRSELPRARPDPQRRHEPFPLTDVQAAYWVGRAAGGMLGGVGCRAYGEIQWPGLDPDRLVEAWAQVVRRHDMLRAEILPSGAQRVLPPSADPDVAIADLRGRDPGEVDRCLEAVRESMGHARGAAEGGPLHALQITRLDGPDLVHLGIDFLIADYVSIGILLDDLQRLYDRTEATPPAPATQFRDYVICARQLSEGPWAEADHAWWMARIEDLPDPPELPIRSTEPAPRFRRLQLRLEPERVAGLRAAAAERGLSPNGVLLSAYAAVLERWSRRGRFTLDITLLNRLPLCPDVGQIVGDFTSIDLLDVDWTLPGTHAMRAVALQQRLWEDLDHQRVSGVSVIREIKRVRRDFLAPFVFTSALGAGPGAPLLREGRRIGWGISQTPQVILDCQVMEWDGLVIHWDHREEALEAGVVDSLFDSFEALLRSLCRGESWDEVDPVRLPAAQIRTVESVNRTAWPVDDRLLHEPLIAWALEHEDQPAVLSPHQTVSFGQLVRLAIGVSRVLRERGVVPGEYVAVRRPRDWLEVAAALGVLLTGAAYLPIDVDQPAVRSAAMLKRGQVRVILGTGAEPGEIDVASVEPAPLAEIPALRGTADQAAYAIFTSGSTGFPKAVVVSHGAARNTLADMERRLGLGAGDRVLGLARLGFDLSVFDIFGVLGVGGTLVLPDPARGVDPGHWAECIRSFGVTLWNSVPAQADLLVRALETRSEALTTLRVALLSGDWIPLDLAPALRTHGPALRIVGLGGATEAAIWSIAYEIEPGQPDRAEWSSVPYGTPLSNQTVHVLDRLGRPCPEWVVGELCIGGLGLATEYLGDLEETEARFVTHPELGRIYRTGDLGRRRPCGNIEFLGREDLQVKIRGHRIELAEVEGALARIPGVGPAVVVATGKPPRGMRLHGFCVPQAVQAPSADAEVQQLVAAAGRTWARNLAGVEIAAVLACAEAYDAAGLAAIQRALGTIHTSLDDGGRLRWGRLVKRWMACSTEAGSGDRADSPTGAVAAEAHDRAWARAEAHHQQIGGAPGLLDYFRRSADALPEILAGRVDPVALLFPDGDLGIADQVYRDAWFNRWANALVAAAAKELVSAAGERGRVLEVGAGTGGTTRAVLDALDTPLELYLATDVSRFFLNEAERQLGARPGVEFALVDVDAAPWAQGLPELSFDLVISADVLHVLADVEAAVARLSGVLRPGGWMIVVEMTREHPLALTSLELLLPGFEPTDRRRGTGRVFLSREEWLDVLDQAGADAVLSLDGDPRLSAIGVCVFAARFGADLAPLEPEAIRQALGSQLPPAMVPAGISLCRALPLSATGKVDRRALTARAEPAGAAVSARAGSRPEGALEQSLARLFEAVVGTTGVGREDSLYDLGGDSLLAAQLATRLREELVACGDRYFDEILRVLIEGATVRSLAEWIAEGGSEGPVALPAVRCRIVADGAEDSGPVRVLVPSCAGTVADTAELVVELRGRVLALEVEDPGRLGQGAVDQIVSELAQELAAASEGPFVLVCGRRSWVHGSLLARWLMDAGLEVRELVLLEPQRLPTGAVAVERALVEDLGAGEAVDGNELAVGSRSERVSACALALAIDPSEVEARLSLGSVLMAAAPEPFYPGDVALVSGEGAAPGEVAWADRCLGRLRVCTLDAVDSW